LQEAVFEFAPRGANLDAQALARLVEELSGDYAGEHQVQQQQGIQVGFPPTPSGPPQVQNLVGPARHRLWTQDRRRTVLVGSDMCAFNAMAPYTHYVDYLPSIEALFQSYQRAARPTGVAFLGHRYINRIPLPPDADPAEYFTVYPRIPADWPHAAHRPFSLLIQALQIEHGQVIMTIGYQQPEPPQYLLDLYARTTDEPPVLFEWEPIRDWHDQAHDAVKRAFEFALTQTCRNLLEREEA
jgi:uncharacterized protein (TIGR04255 family)